ncbi:DUF4231 domain-containing protein [Thalassobacillus pellis]|uniref:DUF4231 domain-containing protein n=1 Tax=Thalassobacillus pellis TaxID=748008 RepID=UPI0019601B66|nr:DUF4231 domain-containing protein [Thalassobacillus pellis]MBM7554808.1 hypothetical protein [Thalassobacillus pellis]
MTEEEYLIQRLEDQIKWYDRKSNKYQKRYKFLKLLEICFAASIPVIAGIPNTLIISILGGGIAFIEGWLSLAKYQENWIEYRSICEFLKQEKFMYLTNSGVYSSESTLSFLVERVESIISKENINWANLNSDKGD